MRKNYLNRIEQLKNKMSEYNMNAFYITNLTNIRYLTGFTGSAASLLVTTKQQSFLSDGRYIEQSKNEVQECDIIISNEIHLKEIKKRNLLDNIDSLGFEGDHVSVTQYENIKKIFPLIKLIKTEMIVEHISAVKDQEEIN